MSPPVARQGVPFTRRRRQAVRISTVDQLQRELYRQESEAHFQAFVLQTAALYGWAAYSIHDSRTQHWGTSTGWPDLFLVKDGRALALELKREDGKTTPTQDLWLALLDRVPGIRTAVWRPSQRETVLRILSGRDQ